jgi:hypothetical protein
LEIRKKRKTELEEHNVLRRKTHHRTALLETLVILVLGLGVGVTGYLGTSVQTAEVQSAGSSFFERFAVAFYSFISPSGVVTFSTSVGTTSQENQEDLGMTSISQNSEGADATSTGYAKMASQNEKSMIVAPSEVFTQSAVASVSESFSDDVTVSPDPLNPNTGLIVPHFRSRDGEAYRFLMVPVADSGGG